MSYDAIFKQALARGLKLSVAALAAAKIYEAQRKSNWAYDTVELLNYICDNLDSSLTEREQRAQVLELLKPYLSPEPITEAEENAMFMSYARSRYHELREKAEVEGLAPEEEEELKQIARLLGIREEEPKVEWTELLTPHSPSTVKRVPRRAAAAPAQRQLTLRPYQLRALEAWRANGRRGVVVMPTGAGKTFVALAAAAEALQRGESVLVLVPTRILKLQWERRVREYLGDGAVHVEVYNTAIKHRLLADLVIVDEVHHARRGTRLFELLQQHAGALLGLTATPESIEYPLVYVQRAWELLGRELANLKLIVHTVTLEPHLAQKYEQLTVRIRALLSKLDPERRREAPQKALEKEFQRLCAVRRMLLSASPAKHAALAAIIAAHARAEKVLVWVESIRVAELLRAKTGGLLIHHKMPPSELAKTLEKWGKESNILYACRMLDEGVDIPDVRIGVIVASGAVLRRAVQRVGRLLRPKDKPAICYLLVARDTIEERVARRLQEYYFSPSPKLV
ncbi:MAG: DEAD/DEAH box helicase [Sulfolobales archaeon]